MEDGISPSLIAESGHAERTGGGWVRTIPAKRAAGSGGRSDRFEWEVRTMQAVSFRTICGLGCLLAGLSVGAESQGPALAVGDKAPQFNANTHTGDLWQTEEYVGRGKYVIVYFYPAAMTGGCTKQACSYRDQAADLSGLDVEVIGISADPVNNLKLFREAHKLNFTLLSDVNGFIAGKFGVPVTKGGIFKTTINGKEVVLRRPYTIARWTFILGKDGKVLYKDTRVDAPNDSRKAVEFLRGLP
jgi:peroxiredoxin Q/BCP